jgi:dipeptidase
MASADLIPFAKSNGWFDQGSGKKFNFRESYGSELGKPSNVMREDRARELLTPKLGTVTVEDLTEVMKDHYEGTTWFDTPHSQTKARPICVSGTQSTQIYHLRSSLPAALGCVMWSSASSPCLGVYAPIWAGHNEKTPAEWQEGKGSFSPESAWWTFENIQRIVAPKNNPDPAFWKANRPAVRGRWDKIEKKGWEQADALEREALKLWQQGKGEEARRLLTNYSNTRLRSDFLEARSILDLLKTKGGKPGRE